MKSLVLNKIDLVDNRRKFDALIREIEKYGKFDKVFYVSAKTGYGIDELEQYLIKMAKPGEWQFPA
jgi:GTP-binding protein Era